VGDHSDESIEQYFEVVLFIMLYKVVPSLDESLACEHSNESYRVDVCLALFTVP